MINGGEKQTHKYIPHNGRSTMIEETKDTKGHVEGLVT